MKSSYTNNRHLYSAYADIGNQKPLHMMNKIYSATKSFSSFTITVLSVLAMLVASQQKASALPYYVQDSNPWGLTQNITCMNNVFGPGGWTQANFSTPAATIFAPTTPFVMLEGSESNAALPTFINNNITTIENWVNAGGRLFINAAPNYGTTQTWGFGGTILNYQFLAGTVTTSVPTNQIFTGPYLPTATTFTATYVAHAYVSGTGLTSLLYNASNPSQSVLCHKLWGMGIVFFGGCTQPNYWSPQAQGINVWQNIFSYVWTYPLQSITPTVPAGPFCAGTNFNITYTSNSLVLNPPNVFTVQLSDGAGSFASPTPIGSEQTVATSGTISCALPANLPTGTGYRIRIVSSDVAFTGLDNGTNLTINAAPVPSATVTPTPNDTVCSGTNVTFNLAFANGGPTPTYQWYLNGNPVANTPNYQSNTLSTGDDVYVVATSNALCALPAVVTSNHTIMSVTPQIPPTITITSSVSGDSGCISLPIVFNSTIALGGPNPTYQWMKNGNPILGETNPSYTDNALADGDVITCELTSNDPCVTPPTVSSNALTMTMVPITVPTISIDAEPGNTICPGSTVMFTATTANGGPSVNYQWLKNGNPVGTDQPTFTSNTLVNGDLIECVFTSNTFCAIPSVLTSNAIQITTFTNTGFLAGTTGSTVTKVAPITTLKNYITDPACNMMATIEPQGANPLLGNTTVKVTIDNNVNSYNGQPYLQRHYDIEPDSFASTATAICTLFAYQSEFDAYNAIAGPLGFPLMPENYIYNGAIRITQYHGTGTQPGNYTGGYEVIYPAVYYDTANDWWQLSFAVEGFSGFYIHTDQFALNVNQPTHSDFSITAFPNPVKDKVTILITGQRGNNPEMSITDLTGKQIVKVPVDSEKAVADISSLASGMYFIKYSDDKRSETIKITKQ